MPQFKMQKPKAVRNKFSSNMSKVFGGKGENKGVWRKRTSESKPRDRIYKESEGGGEEKKAFGGRSYGENAGISPASLRVLLVEGGGL